jgi:hypothetical protein
MPEPRRSDIHPVLWDRLRWLRLPPEIAAARRASPEERSRSLVEWRVRRYEQAAASGDRFAAGGLKDDAAARLRAWSRLLRRNQAAPEDRRRWWESWLDASDLVIWSAEGVLVLLAIGAIIVVGELMVIAIAAAGLLLWRWRPRGRLFRALSRRHCPDCRYDLRGLEAGLDPAALGRDIGPRACPECGAAWPLLPPPPPVEHAIPSATPWILKATPACGLLQHRWRPQMTAHAVPQCLRKCAAPLPHASALRG